MTLSPRAPADHIPSTASSICLAWKTYTIPQDWSVGNELLRHTMGVVSLGILLLPMLVLMLHQLLIGLHIWATLESYEVLGVFGNERCP